MEPLSDDETSTWLVLPDEWEARKVPAPVQDYVLEDHVRSLVLGEHPEHGYFFAEVFEGPGAVFCEWWVDVQDEALAKWATERTDAELAKLFLVNMFAVALSRAEDDTSRNNIWERIHEALVFETKRRTTEPS